MGMQHSWACNWRITLVAECSKAYPLSEATTPSAGSSLARLLAARVAATTPCQRHVHSSVSQRPSNAFLGPSVAS
jgi:hypothetical protein